ncbi:hypothetical protein Barb6_02449 [Bacteroidales bacterium Barb6]|nr:hypothetical protein Barb6_02449 [Bacteroidales bacterium Barb6]
MLKVAYTPVTIWSASVSATGKVVVSFFVRFSVSRKLSQLIHNNAIAAKYIVFFIYAPLC